MSQGASVAIAYAVRYPERVSHLILCGGIPRMNHREKPMRSARHALETLVESIGAKQSAYFQMVTNMYIPENTTPHDQQFFQDLQGVSVSTPNLVKFMARAMPSTCGAVAFVSVPTIVFHSDRDRIAPCEEGRILAAEIPGRICSVIQRESSAVGEEPPGRCFATRSGVLARLIH